MINDAVRLAQIAVAELRTKRGRMATVARRTGTKFQTVQKWKLIPLHHVFAIAKAIGRSPVTLRPDFFIADPMREAEAAKFIADNTARKMPRRKTLPPIKPEYAAIWHDTEAHQTPKQAARAIEKLTGAVIDRTRLRYRFGTRQRKWPPAKPAASLQLGLAPESNPAGG